MAKKVMIDPGMSQRRNCNGQLEDEKDSPAYRIGYETVRALEMEGYETLFTPFIPELSNDVARGRPARVAAISNRFGADCLIRLSTRESEIPSQGSAEAIVFRRDSAAWHLADEVLQSLADSSPLYHNGIQTAAGILILRRAHATSMVLILRLPFAEQEALSNASARNYGECIARGIDRWFSSQEDT